MIECQKEIRKQASTASTLISQTDPILMNAGNRSGVWRAVPVRIRRRL